MKTPTKRDIRSLSLEDLRNFFTENQDQAFRGNQVYQWLWQKGIHDFKGMTNLSKTTRELLEEHFVINHIAIDQQQKSSDGTIKNAVKLHDHLIVESVLIPTATRSTACVSSQVGCSLDCTFCATAKIKRMRNLNADEIYDQVVAMDQQSRLYFGRPLSNIVFMGMGEPLMNYNNLIKAIDKITQPEALGMSPSRITVSTSGIPKMIIKMADDQVRFGLAISLHSARQTLRQELMPFAENFPLEELATAIRYWYQKTKKPVTYEYVVWKGINDGEEDIRALVDFCKPTPCKVNLISYNPIGEDKFLQADKISVEAYQSTLEAHKITATIRRSRGKDIDAACGQLANKGVQV
ncbi:MAG: 23S rRNA (adenine(2503)-C(2))-methyltransferase RlmN [Flavobacteriia bacterium]|jgi:23S rRNA (adenine2503-C2)-methyltransferase|nr:23S rRNA (adenine(2503)-C(2))-methyltransferase RlmN [Flavobacteriia bacterium]